MSSDSKAKQKAITTREEDFSQWYLDVVEQAELAENSAVRGCMVIKPYGYAIWERIQSILDKQIKATGHHNAYFPMLIPKSFLTKEAQHVDGFAQESAVVTHYRLKTNPATREIVVDEDAKLEEEFIIRPTSETIIYDTYSRWVQSYRDLPIMINQWANVMRWEMRTKPFIRTAEFLWQEGHTVHATHDEAETETLAMLKVYQDFIEQYLAVATIPGQKSESEKFAGALRTYTVETMMQDNKAIQAGTSHNLGQNFAQAFDIKFQDKDGEIKYAWQTSWGVSTRLMGALIMSHSDDRGLVLPPQIAPYQVVIVPIIKKPEDEVAIQAVIADIQKQNPDIRFVIDTREYMTVGEKFYHWEKKGVPIRLEIGPKDVEQGQVVLVRRDTAAKAIIPLGDVTAQLSSILESMQGDLLAASQERLESKVFEVSSWDEFKDVINNQKGFALAYFDGTPETEAKIKAETKAVTRCKPLGLQEKEGVCIYSGQKSTTRYIFGRSY